jgi:hypothetical protein
MFAPTMMTTRDWANNESDCMYNVKNVKDSTLARGKADPP